MLWYEINNLAQSPLTIMMVYKEDTTVLHFHLTSYDLTSKSKCIILMIFYLNSFSSSIMFVFFVEQQKQD